MKSFFRRKKQNTKVPTLVETCVKMGQSKDDRMTSDEIVKLNVGGRHFTASRATLTSKPNSKLAKMFARPCADNLAPRQQHVSASLVYSI